ncbi:lysophospholipase [Niveibacterium sp. SC-1]|uniref:alpha/beta hydrolase n=1 Tax=Niveibacterium sp. SC-1 TaxID=3135646 RepID=UPI00312027A4
MSSPELYRRDWPVSAPRAAVLIVHGLGEHSGRYAALAHWFNARGFAVRGYDHQGHGRSPGRRGALSHGEALADDLATEYQRASVELGGAPLLLAESMGGAVASYAVCARRLRPPAMVLISPALRSWAPAWQRGLAEGLSGLLPNLPLRQGLPSRYLSHDARVVAAYRADPLVHAAITPRLADFIFRAGADALAAADRLAVPTLLLVAGEDRFVDPSGSEDFARAAPASLMRFQRFPGLYHEIHNEAEPARSEVLAVLAEWLDAVAISRLQRPAA